VFLLPALEPGGLLGSLQFRRSCFCEFQVVASVRLPYCFQLSISLKAFQTELAERLEQDEPWCFPFAFCLLHQALVEQGRDTLKHRGGVFAVLMVCLAHRFGSLEGTTSDEDGEPPEEPLLLGREQVVAPHKRVAQRLLS